MKGWLLGRYNFLAWYYRRLESIIIDRYLGIDTRGYVDTVLPDNPDAKACETLYYWHLQKIFDHVNIRKGDVFYDLGCGYGRVLFYSAERGFDKVEGFELRPEVCSLAAENIVNYRNREKHDIVVTCIDVVDVDMSNADVIFMFNPFGINTLKKVMEKLKSHSKPLKIIYFYNESKDCEAYMDSLKWTNVEKIKEFWCKIYSS